MHASRVLMLHACWRARAPHLTSLNHLVSTARVEADEPSRLVLHPLRRAIALGAVRDERRARGWRRHHGVARAARTLLRTLGIAVPATTRAAKRTAQFCHAEPLRRRTRRAPWQGTRAIILLFARHSRPVAHAAIDESARCRLAEEAKARQHLFVLLNIILPLTLISREAVVCWRRRRCCTRAVRQAIVV